ncbi:extracellular solute-binding protein [Paenibacillus sp. PL91]|uniref:extracellular solute-binding protein n=1 Tax=Paenibacillus sp. PL91 TaxID=2729538 RepID=UPI00145D0D83|nr:extracellular solute-binding protein [Paenibacillus sp. PL91]MBC9202258.1 extracellular solute-binding protein [Paenibacillus sp. PL91]
MKRMKLFASIGISAVLIATMLSGCGSDNSSGNATNAPAAEGSSDNPYAEHMDISLSWWGVGVGFQPHDEVMQKIEKDFNVTLKAVDIGWDNYKEKSQVWAAAGQLPDIITHSITSDTPAVYNEWVNQGLIHALPDDMSSYPNLKKVFEIDGVEGIRRDGKLYAIPRMTFPTDDMWAVWAVDGAVFVRKDWMEKLGVSDPENFDQFKEMLKAFVSQDPDGNKKDDTTGIVMNTFGYFKNVFAATFPEFGNKGWLKEDGKWIPFYASSKMDEVLRQARALYEEKGLDPDFAVAKAGESNQKFYQNKAGALAFTTNSIYGASGVKAEWEKNNPGEKFFDHVKIMHPWADANGVKYRNVNSAWWSESMINADVDDKKLDRILRIYDWLLSPEGKELFDYGIEGKDFTKDSAGKVTITRPKDGDQFIDLKKYYPSMDIISQLAAWRNAAVLEDNEANRAAFGDESVQFVQDELKWMKDNTEPIPTAFEIATMSTPAKDKLSAIKFDDDFTRVILSNDDPVKMWKEVLKGYDSKGLQQAIDEVTAEMAKFNK